MRKYFQPVLDAQIIYLSLVLLLWHAQIDIFHARGWPLIVVAGGVATTATILTTKSRQVVPSCPVVELRRGIVSTGTQLRTEKNTVLVRPPHPALMVPALYFSTLMCVVTLMAHHASNEPINASLIICLVVLGLILLRQAVTTVAHINTAAALHKIRAAYERRLTHDPLTGLPNRSQLEPLINDLIAQQSARAGTGIVCFVDLDHLKTINDTLGHAAGDGLIQHAARRLEQFDGVDQLIRIGGDEFVVLTFLSPHESPSVFAADLLDHMVHSIDYDNTTVHVSVSIGITTVGRTRSTQLLLQQADTALYRAKEYGRGRFEFFDELIDGAAIQSASFEQQLRRSLVRSDFIVHYLPIVDLRTYTLVGAEALLRWDRPGHGIMGPNQFLKQLQTLDLVGPVGRHIIDRACRDFAPLAITFGFTLTLNISLVQLQEPETVDAILDAVKEYGMPADQIVLELSEHSFSDEAAGASLARLQTAGVKIAIDDFGSGATSLQQLVSHPADVLKFNRGFVSGLSTSPESQAITKALIEIADACEMRVIAEGLEEQSQVDLLESLGCRYGQGWLFSHAVPISDLRRSPLLPEDTASGSTFEQWSADHVPAQRSLESTLPQ